MVSELLKNGEALKRSALTAALTMCVSLGVAVPVRCAPAAEVVVGHVPAEHTARASEPKPARKCMGDLRAFDARIKKDGYWLHAADYGYGYPMFGITYPYAGYVPARGESGASAFVHARPGYDVRTLIAAGNILALRGQQQACEALLTATLVIYQDYLIDLRNAHITKADVPAWRNHLIAAAVPVSEDTTSIKFDDLIGVDVVNSYNVGLGSVEDLLLSRKTGQIAYLVIGRGGVFGIDEKYVPVPWSDFRMTASGVLMVLDTSQANMDSAPQVAERMFGSDVRFGRDNAKVDVYWKTHLSP
jgi:sporulation protein YlmC with PRC-barrel domain